MCSTEQVHLKVWRGKDVVGAAAGRYHSVFFTRHEVYSCGLNAGQLGRNSLLSRSMKSLLHFSREIGEKSGKSAVTVHKCNELRHVRF